MEMNLFNTYGENIGIMELDANVFNVKYNDNLIHQIIVSYLFNKRLGTKAQKSRSEVRGGGIKPWRQKGTGRARAGTIRSPLWRGGGVTFAAKPKIYYKKVNRKMYKKAICAIFSELIRINKLIIVDNIYCPSIKTKHMVQFFNIFKPKNMLILVKSCNKELLLSSRNLFNIILQKIDVLNPVNLLKYDKIIITKEAMTYIYGVLK